MSNSRPLDFNFQNSVWPRPALHARLGAALRAHQHVWIESLALFVLAGVVRCYGLGRVPLWYDELFTVFRSQLNAGYLLGAGAHGDTLPPPYYLLMHGWIALFGASPAVMRLPSLVFSAGTVVVVYLAAAALFDRKTALLAGIFAAFNPFLVMYAQEARPYAMVAFFDGVAVLGLAMYFRPDAARRALWLALFAAAGCVGVYLHYTALFFLAAGFLTVGLEALLNRRPEEGGLAPFLGILLASLVCIAPAVLLAASMASSAALAWIPTVNALSLKYFLVSILVDPLTPGPAWRYVYCVALALVAGFGAWRLRRDQAAMLLLAVMPALFCALLIGASLARPILLPRVAIWLTIPLCILLAGCVTRQPTRTLAAMGAVLVLAAWLLPLGHYFAAPGKEDWRAAARIAAAAPQCGGPVMFVGNSGLGLVYYQPELESRPLFSISLQATNTGLKAVPFQAALADPMETQILRANLIYLRAVPKFLAAHPHTMLVARPVFADMFQLLPPPKIAGVLHGGLVVACY